MMLDSRHQKEEAESGLGSEERDQEPAGMSGLFRVARGAREIVQWTGYLFFACIQPGFEPQHPIWSFEPL